MTLREKILKTFIVTIREVNMHGGPEKFFEKYPVGGMFHAPTTREHEEGEVETGTKLDLEKLNECKKYSKNKLLICADWARLKGAKLGISFKNALGASPYLEDAYNTGKAVGMAFNDSDIDWLLGPAIDVCAKPNTYMSTESDDPKIQTEIFRQFLKGVQDQGVCGTLKHFPGLGTHFVNMHMAPGKNILPFDEWMETYGYMYKELFKENVMCVMTTHISLESYDNEYTEGYRPIATYSKKLTTDLLKGELGFKGAVVTDALSMGGVATGNTVDSAVQAFKAGADLLLWPPVEAAEKIEELILNGEIPMSRLEDALSRIEKMEKFRNDALENKTYDKPDPEFADSYQLKKADHAMCLLRNDIGLIPLDENQYKKILLVDVARTVGISGAAKALKAELEERNIECEITRDVYDGYSFGCWQPEVDKIQAQYDLVAFVLNVDFSNNLDESHMLIWASQLFDKNKKIMLNFNSSPYVAHEYFPEVPTYVETHVNYLIEETAKILVDKLFGKSEFIGKNTLTKI